jgi:hypothetical protein
MQHATRLMMSTPRRSVTNTSDNNTAAAASAPTVTPVTVGVTVGQGATSASATSTACSNSGMLAGLALQDHINALYSSLTDVHRATFVEVSSKALYDCVDYFQFLLCSAI